MNDSFIIRLYPRPNLPGEHEVLGAQLRQLEKNATGLAQQLLESRQRSDADLKEMRKNVKDLGESVEQHDAMTSELMRRAEEIAKTAEELGDDSPTADAQNTALIMPKTQVEALAKSLLLLHPVYAVFGLTVVTGLVVSVCARYLR